MFDDVTLVEEASTTDTGRMDCFNPRVPERPWRSLAMDFIVKLPQSKEPATNELFDGIMVVVDRFTKFGKFIPYRETFKVEDIAQVFIKWVVALHGMPQELVTDRGSVFTSNFWMALMRQFQVKHKLSTSFHPQTDGQTERLNQTLEQYLRAYVNRDQNNWVELLPMAQLAYNSTPSESTGLSPFQLAYGTEMEVVPITDPDDPSPAAAERAIRLLDMQDKARLDLQFYQQNMARYANRRRIEGPILKEGDRVYLLRRNIKSDKPSKKLDAVKLGPFKIKTKRGPVNFELQLPKQMRIHPVFHMSLLEPAAPDAALQTEPSPIDPDYEEPVYVVDKIVDDAWIDGQHKYLVKWKGYSHTETTWETKDSFTTKAPIDQYQRKKERQAPPRSRPAGRRGRPRS